MSNSVLSLGKDCCVLISFQLPHYRDWNNLRSTCSDFYRWLNINTALRRWDDEIRHPLYRTPKTFCEWIPMLKFYDRMLHGKCVKASITDSSGEKSYSKFAYRYMTNWMARWNKSIGVGLKILNAEKSWVCPFHIGFRNCFVLAHHVFIISFGTDVVIFDEEGKTSSINLMDHIGPLKKYRMISASDKKGFQLWRCFEDNKILPANIVIIRFISKSETKYEIKKIEIGTNFEFDMVPFYSDDKIIAAEFKPSHTPRSLVLMDMNRKILWESSFGGLNAEIHKINDHLVLIEFYRDYILISKICGKTFKTSDSMVITVPSTRLSFSTFEDWHKDYVLPRLGYQIFGIEKQNKVNLPNLFRFDLLRFEKVSFDNVNISCNVGDTLHVTDNGFWVSGYHYSFEPPTTK